MDATANITEVGRGVDFYVPAFEVRARSRRLDSETLHDILQVSYKDEINGIDSFEITVNNWDAAKRTFKYSDERTFEPGQELEVSMGYRARGGMRQMIIGEITSLRPTFPAGGQPTLSVSGLSLLHRFRKETVSKAYADTTDKEIADDIAKRLGATIHIDPPSASAKVDYLLQNAEFDIVFLLRRARDIGFDLHLMSEQERRDAGLPVSKPALFYGPSERVRQVAYELVYGKSLIQFQPTLTTANQVGEVVVQGWDPVHKAAIVGTATRDQLTGKHPRVGEIEASFKQRKEVVTKKPVPSKSEADRVALEYLKRISEDLVTASGSTIGLPDLRAGGRVGISGVGTRFNGKYRVRSSAHTIGDAGYTTQFECYLEGGS